MKNKAIYLGIGVLVLIGLIIGAYFLFNPKSDTKENVVEEEVKTIESSSDLAISLSDLPSGWEISTRGERVKSDVSDYGISLGWKEGYNIVFRKTESKDMTISESISEYPPENISYILDESKDILKLFGEGLDGRKVNYLGDEFGRRYRFDVLSNPEIGDDSIAYKLVYTESTEVAYILEFVKEDYYIHMDGYDYELIKELAKKVESKI